jgi:Domain of unknown function (DUF4159)
VVLDAFGQATDAGELPGVPGEDLAKAVAEGPTITLRPGLYAGPDRRVALNTIGAGTELQPASWPSGVAVEQLDGRVAQALKGSFLTAALTFLLIDVLASLWLAGRLGGLRRGVAVLALGLVAIQPQGLRAEDASDPLPEDDFALEATTSVVLAHVLTGDPKVDEIAAAGLQGLSEKLWQRTSIEPARPIGVDIERDELAFFPFLYWPVSAGEKQPSAEAYAKLNRYLQTGGMILFDTRDADVTGFGGSTPEGQTLQLIASGLDIPPLEPMPTDHVLTRTFYLLQDFPGRHPRGPVWVEAAPMAAAEAEEGMPFRNLNDGVTPVVIGGNDWAAAWAVDDYGAPLLPIGRGMAGERQREIAYRFGINLIMHVLTGNYKSDQVHVPALLERLGQ